MATVALLSTVALTGCGATRNAAAGDDDGDEMANLMLDAEHWALDGTAEAYLAAGYDIGDLTALFEPCSGQSYRFVLRARR